MYPGPIQPMMLLLEKTENHSVAVSKVLQGFVSSRLVFPTDSKYPKTPH